MCDRCQRKLKPHPLAPKFQDTWDNLYNTQLYCDLKTYRFTRLYLSYNKIQMYIISQLKLTCLLIQETKPDWRMQNCQLIIRQDFPQQVRFLTKYQFCENAGMFRFFPTNRGTWNTESIFIIGKLTGSDCLPIPQTTHHH